MEPSGVTVVLLTARYHRCPRLWATGQKKGEGFSAEEIHCSAHPDHPQQTGQLASVSASTGQWNSRPLQALAGNGAQSQLEHRVCGGPQQGLPGRTSATYWIAFCSRPKHKLRWWLLSRQLLSP